MQTPAPRRRVVCWSPRWHSGVRFSRQTFNTNLSFRSSSSGRAYARGEAAVLGELDILPRERAEDPGLAALRGRRQGPGPAGPKRALRRRTWGM